MLEYAKNLNSRRVGASLGCAFALILGLHAASQTPAQSADLYGYETRDRTYPADDPRYADIYDIPRRDRFAGSDARGEYDRETYRPEFYREDRVEDRDYDARDDRYEHDDRRPREWDGPAPAGRYAVDKAPSIDDRDSRPAYGEHPREHYAGRGPYLRPFSLKDGPPAERPYVEPGRYEPSGFEVERYRRPASRYREPPFRQKRACLGRRDMKQALHADGWRGFDDFNLARDRAKVTAHRIHNGQPFILTLDGCTGDIIAALPIERRYDR